MGPYDEPQPQPDVPSVLVIDDSPLVRRLVHLALDEEHGWRVHEAESGELGIELAARELPAVILLDVEMPGLNGPETLRRLRERDDTRGLPILFLTALSGGVEAADLLAAGASGIIAKPFDPERLATEIASAVGWAQ